jgi:hypothetical protein
MLGKDKVKEKVEWILAHETDLICGIDFINHEDLSTSLLELIPDLILNQVPQRLNFYLTCGETNTRSNQTLIDSLLLIPKRISHGFQLAYKP